MAKPPVSSAFRSRRGIALLLATALPLAGCALAGVLDGPGGGPNGRGMLARAVDSIEEGRPEEAVPELERLVARYPGRLETRWLLLQAYVELAMDARRDDRLREYTDYLEKAYDQAFAILKLDPTDARVHHMMGVIAAYQGDVERAYTNFDNSRRLAPRHPYTSVDLAETSVYLGKVGTARHYLARARKLGAHPAACEVVEVLAAWRFDDFMEVDEVFESVYAMNPDAIRHWNDPEEPIESFEDFKMHCCSLPFCGPYMKKGCPPGTLKAALETVDAETRRRELVLEMMRRRELEQIYRNRRELEIVIEPPDELEGEAR